MILFSKTVTGNALISRPPQLRVLSSWLSIGCSKNSHSIGLVGLFLEKLPITIPAPTLSPSLEFATETIKVSLPVVGFIFLPAIAMAETPPDGK